MILRVHALINYSVADLGMINEWIESKGHIVTATAVYRNEKFPDMDAFDLLIILGGVMGAYEEAEHPWLRNEKQFILEAIKCNKVILGICLGAQLIAEVLGGKVYPHKHHEIGWWPVHFTHEIKDIDLFNGVPKQLPLFQYHGDTFDLPDGAIRLASSEATKNQAFIYNDRILGLQFHPEFSEEKLQEIVHLHGDNIKPGPYTQLPEEFLGQSRNVEEAREFLFRLLDNLEQKVKE